MRESTGNVFTTYEWYGDPVSIAVVPEPTGSLASLAGLAAFTLRRRQQRE